jgi:hypothetical protein
MSTAMSELMRGERRDMVVRQTAIRIIATLDRFIPAACRSDAVYALAEDLHKNGLELTSRAEREQYEAWKSTLLAGDLQRIEIEPIEPTGIVLHPRTER